jgi:HD-GYP domain-containing protein (c-di-GMP phosphodiesterase class II)
MEHYVDRLERIYHQELFTDKLKLVYEEINSKVPSIERISLSLYDKECDTLKTYTHHSKAENPLSNYQAKLSDSESLQEIAKSGQPRIVNDMSIYEFVKKRHAVEIKTQGYQSSYTYPIFNKGNFYGFIFVNSTSLNTFNETILENILPLVHLIAAFTIIELSAIKVLTATVHTAVELTHRRDSETGQHLARMARYSRLIAMDVAEKYDLSDEVTEHIYLFAPLHDVGKISIPDEILFKPLQLTGAEFELMKTHTTTGLDIINKILKNYHLDNMQYTDVLRNIVKHHHEKMDGSGYPDGLVADDIPIEARIVCVADIFDALTSERPYKKAWPIKDAFDELERLKGKELDADCINALINNREVIEQIQDLFVDDAVNAADI